MNKESLTSILKVVLVLGFILVPPILKALAKRKEAKTKSPLSPSLSDLQRNKIKPARQPQRKTFIKPETQKNVEDVLAKIFGADDGIGNKSSKLTQARAPLPSRVHKQESPPKSQPVIKAEAAKEELPRFKTSIKEFKTNIPSLPSDIKSFEPNIHTAAEVSGQASPFLQKFRKFDREDLRYGIIISEILGPPVSLKPDSLM